MPPNGKGISGVGVSVASSSVTSVSVGVGVSVQAHLYMFQADQSVNDYLICIELREKISLG